MRPDEAAIAEHIAGDVKTFASYICEEYHTLHGEPPIGEYGMILEKFI